MVEHGPFAVAILGGGHDLSDTVEKMSDAQGEFIRIYTTKCVEFAQE